MDKIIVIIGATNGFGLETAKQFKGGKRYLKIKHKYLLPDQLKE